jgi:putative membrane protein
MTTRITTAALAAALLLGGTSLAAAQTSSGTAPATGAGAGTNSPSNVTAQPNAPTAQQEQQGRPREASGSSGSSQQSGDGQITPGANSFTEAQAKSRIESMGYQQVTNLKKDPNTSVWSGDATKEGKQVQVQLDYQGDVVAK